MASAQCRTFLNERLSRAEVLPSNSTADAARQLGRRRSGGDAAERPTAAINSKDFFEAGSAAGNS